MSADDLITVLVPVSPLPSHPSLDVLDATLTSVRSYLPAAHIVIMADGVRPEQEHREADYATFLDLLDAQWGDRITLASHRHHQHQARMTRQALAEEVTTPLVLFVEGDCTLWGDIRFDVLADLLMVGKANTVRLHHEASILQGHEWLNVKGGTIENVRGRSGLGSAPLVATAQWSQRPHLSRADYYRWLLGPRHFHPDTRSMIEDVVHGVVIEDWRRGGVAGWQEHALYIYAAQDEHGSLKHSETCDGRQDDPKYPMHLLPPPGGPTFDEWKAEQ